MQVLDIIQSAAFKAGIIPSFNPDEIPGDVVAAGRQILANEILPSLNCDRTIDITVTSRTYTPVNGMIVLTPLKQPIENFNIIGYSQYTADDLLNPNQPYWRDEIVRLRPTWLNDDFTVNEWPTNTFGDYCQAAMWTTDMQLVYGNSPTQRAIMAEVNVDFPPMRVEAVLEHSSRIKYDYLYREEFEQIIGSGLPGVYTVEEYSDKLVILLKGTDQPKCLILPVPLQIIDSDHDNAGTIIAPEKFKRFLIDSLAMSLAIVYGVTTVENMAQQASQSYNLLKKNKTQQQHPADLTQVIANKLRPSGYGRRYYAGFGV